MSIESLRWLIWLTSSSVLHPHSSHSQSHGSKNAIHTEPHVLESRWLRNFPAKDAAQSCIRMVQNLSEFLFINYICTYMNVRILICEWEQLIQLCRFHAHVGLPINFEASPLQGPSFCRHLSQILNLQKQTNKYTALEVSVDGLPLSKPNWCIAWSRYQQIENLAAACGRTRFFKALLHSFICFFFDLEPVLQESK